MTLGGRINRLRTERKLSQGELAEALGVSRQSISKWETDASVPELDKLIRLSQLFGVTLDELATGVAPAAGVSPGGEQARAEPPPPHRTAGIVLLGSGVLAAILLTLAGGLLAGVILALPFVACGLICLLVRRRAGLWCAWALYVAVELYLRYATGLSWRMTLMTPWFEPEMNYMRLAISWVQLAVMVVMAAATVRSFAGGTLEWSAAVKKRLLLLCGLLAVTFVPGTPLSYWIHPNLEWAVLDFLRLGIVSALLSILVRLRKGKNV